MITFALLTLIFSLIFVLKCCYIFSFKIIFLGNFNVIFKNIRYLNQQPVLRPNKKEFEEDALKAKSAQEKISLMSEDISAWKRTGQWGSGNWKSTEAGKLYDSYIREVNNFQKKWSGRPKGSPIFDLNKYSSPFITDCNDNFTALSLKRGLEFFEKYIPSFFDKKNKELIEFQTKSEKSGANR